MRALAFRLRPRPRLPKMGILPQVIAMLLLMGLVGAMAIEPTRQLIAQRNRISDMSTELESIERSNDRLERRILRLNDPDFIEQRAREYGLARPDETTIRVLPPSRSVQQEEARRKAARRQVQPAPEKPGFIEGVLNFVGF